MHHYLNRIVFPLKCHLVRCHTMTFFKFFPQTLYENIHKETQISQKLHKLTFKSKIQKKALIRTVSSLGHSLFHIKIVKVLSPANYGLMVS